MKKLTNFLSVSLVLFCIQTLVDASAAYCKQNSKKFIRILALFILTLLLSCSPANKSYGQNTFVNKIYLQASAGGTSYNGFQTEVGIQAILKKNWSTTFSYNKIEDMTPKNQPSDYRPETGIVLIFPYTYQVTTKMSVYSITAGKMFPAGRKIWFTTEAGISIVNGDKIIYKQNQNSTQSEYIFFGVISPSNYSTTVEDKSTLGGMLRADFNWAFSSFMGLGAGVFANLNSIQSPVGYNLKLTMGWMHRGKKVKK